MAEAEDRDGDEPGRGPLEGVTVVEVANFVSGPFGALMLADLGADVVKVEPPRGDPYRRFGRPTTGTSAEFVNVNRGKRSIALDLKDPEGLATLRRLLDRADVLLANWRPKVAGRLGLADHLLAQANPRLVRVYISGYGPSGPYADQATFDSNIQARSGLAWLEGGDGAPRLVAGYLVDKMTGVFAVQAALAALYERERTGEGRAVDVPMLDTVAYFNYPDLYAKRTLVDHQPDDPRNLLVSGNRPVPARDGWVQVSAVTGDQIRAAVTALGHPEWGEVILSQADGPAVGTALRDLVGQALATMTVAEAMARFDAHDVPAAPCDDPDQHLADPQVVHAGIYRVAEDPVLGRVRSVRHPARSPGWGRLEASGAVPGLDADHQAVVADLDDAG